jgi:hypothetical protein
MSTELLKASRPEPLGLSRAKAEEFAQSVAGQLHFEPGDDLMPLVARIGGRISYSEAEDETSSGGSIEIRDDKFLIRLAMDTGPLRDRFTIAHELGHYVLHYLYPNQRLDKNITWLRAARYGTGQVEKEANWFAAGFLMPEDKFRHEWRTHSGNLLTLSRLFKVSPQASSVRAKALGLA